MCVWHKTHARSFPYNTVSETRIIRCDAFALSGCYAAMLVVFCRCFGTAYLSNHQRSGILHGLNDPTAWPYTSVNKWEYKLCNITKQPRSQPHRSPSLKSSKLFRYVKYVYIQNMYRCTVSIVGMVRLLYGQPRNSSSIPYRAKRFLHHHQGTSRLWRTHTHTHTQDFSITIAGFLFGDIVAGVWSWLLNLV